MANVPFTGGDLNPYFRSAEGTGTNIDPFVLNNRIVGPTLDALQLLDDVVVLTGAAVPTKAYFIAGTDGTNARALKTNTSGNLEVLITGAGLTALELIDDAVGTTGAATPAKGILFVGTDGTNARGIKTNTGGVLETIESGQTTGGLTLHSRISVPTDEVNVKNAAGQIFYLNVSNTNASARWLKIYDSNVAPTLGVGTPALRFLIPGGASGLDLYVGQGLPLSTGISYTLTTGVADADTGAVAANEVVVNMGYR
jgi:hypothetical protein